MAPGMVVCCVPPGSVSGLELGGSPVGTGVGGGVPNVVGTEVTPGSVVVGPETVVVLTPGGTVEVPGGIVEVLLGGLVVVVVVVEVVVVVVVEVVVVVVVVVVAGGATTKVAEAELVPWPTDLATTVCAPVAAPAGTVRTVENDPAPSARTFPIPASSHRICSISSGPKPLPETTKVSPG